MSWHSLASPLLLAVACGAADAAPAAACQRSSPPHTVALVELFTSEGCSSCPPADRWLSTLATRYGSEQLVPLSLHVDYWNYLGWQDRFAQAQFSERQRQLAQRSASPVAYTPEVFVGMRELRSWHDAASFEQRLRQINRQPARADISLAMQGGETGTLAAEAQFRAPATENGRNSLQGVLVLYEDRLESSVRRGENRGATLRHDHVVRYWSPPFPLRPDGTPQTVRRTLELGAEWNRTKLGLAAFVHDSRTGEVLQAISLPVCVAAAR
ncbi:MAG TPA: DUF1223 domain-containing protein [Accumulibacter sp.]|uniref:DUF1223 domain-containing protein n=2 Tax=Candidatus Accumulibacter TaxID=327159 RepID=A0A080M9E0_9PROT|nr:MULTISPECIES: DUF1223 domain-containing protein [Candidatus Accumulibacter]KFB77581.1 MAG: putative secreted protein [Candidatus Accumulibacter cognatus]MBL8401633.1 DUF1223 domain-containing protein [Accumulibacter sp.]MBN8516415.1 DUF1223 domain-containing protein [Accumulibacter sp.]MCC2869270.1 DUF1223 domain-containing protein [Candidatus Accumulibacter phosphatis]MCM8580984.1 DUF1223 domain-containing protein [Accumulibacter sp.]